MVPHKVCDATVFSLFIEHKYCSSQDLDRILDAFERDIPYIKTTAQATLAIERLRSNNGDSLDGGVGFSWNQSIIVFGQSGRNNPLFTKEFLSRLFTSFQHRPLQPLVVPFLNLRKPGHLSQLPLHCQGATVDPLQRVHVRVQHLANLMDRVSRVLSSSS